MKNKILAITRDTIPYVKELRQLSLIKSVAGSILMQQLDYWFYRYPDGFYKFLQSCPNHKAYAEGDSWIEELAFSSDEFRTAFDTIGVRYTSKTAWKTTEHPFVKEVEGKRTEVYYCSYHDKKEGVTWYFRNHIFVDAALDTLIIVQRKTPEAPRVKPMPVNGERQSTVNREPQSIEMGNAHLHRSGTPIYRDGECPSTVLYTEITPEINSEITPPLSPQGEPEQESEGSKPIESNTPEPSPTSSTSLQTQPSLSTQQIVPHEDREFAGQSTLSGDTRQSSGASIDSDKAINELHGQNTDGVVSVHSDSGTFASGENGIIHSETAGISRGASTGAGCAGSVERVVGQARTVTKPANLSQDASARYEASMKSRTARAKGKEALPIYRTGWGWEEIKPEFIDWLCAVYLPDTPYYKKRSLPTELQDAIGWVNRKEKGGEGKEVEARFEQMIESKMNPAYNAQVQSQQQTYMYVQNSLEKPQGSIW